MEDADRRLLAEARIDLVQHALEVAAQLRISVVGGLDRNVLAVIAEIEHQHVVARRQVLPEREIGIGRKAVAVRHHQADAGWIAMAPHADVRAVLERNIDGLPRHRNDEIHSLISTNFSGAANALRMVAVCLPACDHLYYWFLCA